MKRIAVLLSGGGTNLQALMDAIEDGRLAGEIVLVASNKSGAYGLERARQAAIPSLSFPRTRFRRLPNWREAYDVALAEAVAGFRPNLVVLAGWMHIFSAAFLERFPQRVLNLHPALPGTFPGAHGIEDAFAAFQAGEIQASGCMVHWATPELDAGPVVAQATVPFEANDTVAGYAARLHRAEHKLIVEAVQIALALPTI